MSSLRLHQIRFLDWEPVSLEIEAGGKVGITGASGSGKSLLMRAIADLDLHDGEAFIDGEARHSMPAPEWRRRVALLPADAAWWYDTVGEHFRAQPGPNWEELGFSPDSADWTISRLSAGERQRLALLRMLEGNPDVLLLDEPTANLDAENTNRVEALVNRYQSATGAALLWVSHDTKQLNRTADTVFRMIGRHLEVIAET